MLIASTPTTPTGGLAISVEDGHWLIAALGVGDDRPPRDMAGFEAFLGGLRDPALARMAERLEPVSDVMVHRQTANRRRHYDEQDDWPDGVVVMGDAFCAFNPVYGQGIAVGACEAVLVRDAISAGMKPGGARQLLQQFAKLVALPWSIATATDLQYPTCQQSPTRLGALQDNWARQLEKLSVHGNERAAFARSSVYHLMAPPRRLLHPASDLGGRHRRSARLRTRQSPPRPGCVTPAHSTTHRFTRLRQVTTRPRYRRRAAVRCLSSTLESSDTPPALSPGVRRGVGQRPVRRFPGRDRRC